MNDELVKVLGVEFHWTKYIAAIAANRASAYTKNALMEDIVADVTADIIMSAKDGRLAVALSKAKEASADETELVKNLKKVVMKAAWYRVSDAVRYRYKQRSIQFSQIGTEESGPLDVAARFEGEEIGQEYGVLLAKELELMAQAAEWKKQTKLARRYRLAATVVPGKLEGLTMPELMERHEVKSSSTMQAIFDDIGQALARVAGRLQDATLLRGTAGVQVG